ncbi:Transport-associated protein [Burkholderia sp. 8Y]|uniref:BON domain-containing protein n=1 Tax=Burkholderia sp. 8Y TaxID=2653133 RepID=UPI0012F0D39F|nr:BON domain-containing protein [Burkholderia sp. 8Y]VXB10924.1 Transport-associated protein [Burkholderia sp. 8Y]
MKNVRAFKLAIASLLLVSSVNGWSQTGETASTPDASATAASESASPAAGRKANRALRRKVYAAISKQKEISAGDISVIAKDGAVTLGGTVRDASQISQVEDIARGVAGVTSVTNKLTVKKPLGGM